jgi:hypothetical protein
MPSPVTTTLRLAELTSRGYSAPRSRSGSTGISGSKCDPKSVWLGHPVELVETDGAA